MNMKQHIEEAFPVTLFASPLCRDMAIERILRTIEIERKHAAATGVADLPAEEKPVAEAKAVEPEQKKIQTQGEKLAAELLSNAKFPREVRDLARLLAISCVKAAGESHRNRCDIMNRLASAFRIEKARGAAAAAGDMEHGWLYNPSREHNLARAIERELEKVTIRAN